MTADERAAAMIEMVDRGDGNRSIRFKGQGPLLWHSGDASLMKYRQEAMVQAIAEAIHDAVMADREAIKTICHQDADFWNPHPEECPEDCTSLKLIWHRGQAMAQEAIELAARISILPQP